eukprot:SAG11_NODE_16101_length_557_cov_0.561135_1_plen_145_part_01
MVATHLCQRQGPYLCTASSVAPSAGGIEPVQPHTPIHDPPGSFQPTLSAQEIAFFKDQGFLVKRGLIPEEVHAHNAHLQPASIRIYICLLVTLQVCVGTPPAARPNLGGARSTAANRPARGSSELVRSTAPLDKHQRPGLHCRGR